MRAIVTVIGKDRVGIIADVTALLAQYGVNVLDISQTVMNEYFTMVMLTDVQGCTTDFSTLRDALVDLGEQMALSIRIQHEDIFNAMHAVN
jgi:ACT domain-containing protein